MTDESRFDLPDAQLPQLLPLQASHDPGDYRDQIKALMLEVFGEQVASAVFDANVLGAAHLGSLDLVRRFIHADGLGMLRSDQAAPATRYLYRAWRQETKQGRGLHFLRTYLQLLFPEQARIAQLWQDRRFPYGHDDGLIRNEPRPIWTHYLGQPGLEVDGTWTLGESVLAPGDTPALRWPNPDHLWLTSRVQIILDVDVIANAAPTVYERSVLDKLFAVLRSVMPARLVPAFVFAITLLLEIRVLTRQYLALRKHSTMGYPWCGRSLSEYSDRRWSLGVDGQYVTLPEAFGSFRLGERRGGLSVWHLRGCRAERQMMARKWTTASAYRLPIIGEADRRLDGTWALSRRQADALTHGRWRLPMTLPMRPETVSRWIDHFRIDYPFTPRSLDQTRTLDGYWRLGPGAPKLGQPFHGRRLGAWPLGRRPGIVTDDAMDARKFWYGLHVAPVRLASGTRLTGWPLGGFRLPSSRIVVRQRPATAQPTAISSTATLRQQISVGYPVSAHRLTRLQTLNGLWRLQPGRSLPHIHRRLRLDGRFALPRPVSVMTE